MNARDSRRRTRIALALMASPLLILGSGAASAQQTAAVQPQNLGVLEHQAGGVDVVLLDVRRTAGDVLTVKWQYRNNTNERKQLTDQRTGWVDPYRLALDAYVLDEQNRTKYPVARDEQKNPIAAAHGAINMFIFVGPKQTLSTWAKFQAPPADVQTVTIQIPGAGLFENVPIGK